MSSELAASAVKPSATPSKADVERWRTLARDEQLRRLRDALDHVDSANTVAVTMTEILAEARRRAERRRDRIPTFATRQD